METEGQEVVFAESKERARALNSTAEAIVQAYVRVGVSLVVPEGTEVNSYKDLRRTYPYDSLWIARADAPGSGDYVVYSWAKASIILVKVKGATYYEVDQEPKYIVDCENTRCLYTGRTHFGNCRQLCDYDRCLYYGKYHLGECTTPCINNKCSRYGRCHMGNCSNEQGSDALLGTNILSLLAGGGQGSKAGTGQSGAQVINSLVNIF